ncbi:MAG TPA: carboxypeptidase-like regulatory domain-containing protein, partial [Blastocatellia bacterium]|nr:carboxypeptidase-like regulatory domain-containing protein [Blastocatellia bacterium]
MRVGPPRVCVLLIAIVLTAWASQRVLRAGIQQPEGASITGTVEDDQGQPVQDAKVTLIRQEVSSSLLTHSDGKFEFKKVLPGPCELTVEVPGFRKQVINIMISRAGETVLQLVKLVPSSLHVSVFDSGSRQPLGGVAVSLSGGERPAQLAARGLTDEAGDVFFGRLTPGSYRLTASLRGYDDYQSVVFISSAKITTEFALPLSIAPVIPINDRASTRYSVPNIPSKNVQAIF